MVKYFGETICQYKSKDDKTCMRKGYYINSNKQIMCGYHSYKETRTILPKNPKRIKNKKVIIKKHNDKCKLIAEQNEKLNKNGDVKCCKMYMMKDVKLTDGYINIFPNYKHKNRIDGIGLPSLSPKSIGPVDHGQPNLPQAYNLENFHQGNKVFPSEIKNGKPTKQFFKTQKNMYFDKTPYRHKPNRTDEDKKLGNIPVYSIWISKNEKQHNIDYFTSRQFYCHFYERAIKKHKDFVKLKRMIKHGYNLMIVGYDGFDVTKTIEEHYLDVSRPFGHEMVLYTMLTTKPKDYIWHKYKTFEY